MKFELPKLEYAYDALEPYIDAKTMEIHHSKHHQAYLDKFNSVLAENPQLNFDSAEEILINLNTLEVNDEDRKVLKNHGGGFVNHAFFWKCMGPEKEIDNGLVAEISKTFGSMEEFKATFSKTAMSRFGSGWAWLVRDENKELKIYSLPNQDSPLTLGHTPIFCLDVWEHAYYLKYQNRRAEYVENWWNVLKSI
ncbi:MAG: Superoxide dismutase [Candidatus Magasanikbacteria bacterium GW2011_GWA2_40_10]|uniref:Superoxide dismutase n=1 Tax=Candidatus Magasanikbacteria bacterium GW2011_GWA2_40_10 TaxID=1619037 RepID=A0A0G0Q4V1_9BACT|nr:MAG: Superoxide dismutase [Candidatus Magasanikbacteria bacterium GW2011_GWA2_40_10]